ncbi:hypothetical protein [Okibacterium endophyticum]
MSDAMVDADTGTGLSTNYSERVGNIGPNVRRLNIEEQREELAATIAAIRRKVNAGMAVAALGAIVAAALAIVISVGSLRKHRDAEAQLASHRRGRSRRGEEG